MKEVSDRYNKKVVPKKVHHNINTSVSSSLLNESKKFYLDKFSGDLPAVDLPYDKPRMKNRNFNGNHISVNIDNKLTTLIKNLLKQLQLL